MTKRARIINGEAVDVMTVDPAAYFTADVAAQFVTVPNQVKNGWRLTDDTWAAPVAVLPPRKRVVDRQEFLMLIPANKRFLIRAYAAEKVADTDPTYLARGIVSEILNTMDTATFINLDAPPNIDAVGFVQSLGLLSADEAAVILAGPLAD